ncbi:MAG TPA: cellulase family glycosylhydrolase [Verrucomicrobiae bacterium]|nr:cellulase family glycosylhydrolase [Verrucomicrobiae bacterium]
MNFTLVNPIGRSLLYICFLAVAAGGLHAQTLTDIGSAAPTPGTNDIDQLSTPGNTTRPDGINYFSNNNPPVGQTFIIGTNALNLASVAIKTAGLNSGNGYGTPATTPTYYLRIYSISGSTATSLISFSAANPGFADGDWLKWSGINVPLQANQTYAFTFGIEPSGGGYAALAVATNEYSGGEIVTIPINGGTITTGSSHTFDAVFDLGFRTAPTNISPSMPFPTPTYGWNLGDTLEATWGVPNWTAAPFYTAANAGFNAVRIPCAWDFNSTTNISGGITNYVINSAFMAQVKQAVNDAIAAGMYVMINDHWDDGWLENNIGTNVDATINAKMNAYWTQIATAFAGYDNHLLFAAANEPNVNNTAEEVTLMYYYQTFVNAVRGAGGNNTNRWLVLQSVADPTWMNALPTDTVSNRLMVEYHQYTPSLFTIIHTDQSWGDAIYFWGPAYDYSGDPTRNATWGEEYAIDSFFQQLADLYVSKGVPVMIGEFGAYSSSLTNATEATWNTDSVDYWNKYVAESARGHGLSPFYWSTVNSPWDWTSGAIYDTQIVSELTGGAAPPPPNGAPYAPSGLTATAGNGQIILSWTADSGATSYNLYRSTASGFESSNAAPVITGITGTSYTNTALNSGTPYYYQVVAVDSSGLSGFSPEVHATTSGVSDSAQFNFETSSQGWTGGGGIVSGVATSTAQHYAGNQSLAVNFNGSAAGTASPSVGNVAIVPGTTITFHVWIPSSSKVTTLQPYLQDYNWAWSSSWYPSLTANAWNTLTLTVPTNAVPPLQALGVQFITSAGWTGTCYIDSISYITAVPDFNLAANPTSLTVSSGTNGASTITVTPVNGLNACYTLSISNLPSGVSASFTNNPMTGGASLLTLTASNNVTSGTTNVTVMATAGLISHTQTIAITLTGPTNSPPVLAAITNRIVNAGQTVAFTANATDTDQPPPTLTFALLAGATNATLDTSSGAFSFRPLVTQANSTNNFTMSVSDNGTPSLNATQSFSIVVNPLSAPAVSIVSVAGGQFSFSVGGQSGPDYAVEASTNLTLWSTVFITNSPALPFVWMDTNSPAASQRFYRVKLGPPLP